MTRHSHSPSLILWLVALLTRVGAEPLGEGRVRLDSGQPVSGAQVLLFDLADLRAPPVAATTDEAGRFALPPGVLPGRAVPERFGLGANYPNPFNPSTIIPYQLPAAMYVRLEVFNILGQRVATLVEGERPAGSHTATWGAADAKGRAVAAGVYLYRLTGEGRRLTRRMVLIDGQAGVAVGVPGASAVTGQEFPEAAKVYGLTVSGEGLVTYLDPSFRPQPGMAPPDIVVEEPRGTPRAKAAAAAILGDVDNNGRVDIFDALLIAVYSANPALVMPNNGDITLGDVNRDGRTDLTDAYHVATYTVNPSDPTLPAGIGQALAQQPPPPPPPGTAASKLYWSDWGTDKIQRSDLDGSNVEDVVSGAGLNGPDGLSLDLAGGRIYWADAGTNKIQRANLDGSGVEDLVTGLGIPYGLALDVSGGKMYWTNRQTNRIQRANLDGSGVEDLVTSGLTFPGALALDLAGRRMYWTNSGAGKIQRSTLSGANVEDLVTSGLSSPLGLALDVSGGKIYWTDRGTDKIQRSNLSGTNVEDLVTSGLQSPNGLALDVAGGKMYWADEGTNKVQRANLDGSGVEDLLTGADGLIDPSGIAVGGTSGTSTGGGGGGGGGTGPAPDLIVEAPTVSSSSPAAGASFTLRATVRNQGSGRSASTTLRYYRSTDATITTSDTEVGTDYVGSLSAGRTSAESISLRAPSSAGTYYYGACVESVSGESNTGNNCSSAVTVTVGAGPAPDLIVEAPTVSGSPLAGASFTLRATVRNQGSGRSGSTTLRYYLFTDATTTSGDTTEVGTDYVSSLSAGRTSAESIRLRAPSSAGTYYYSACVESVSGESNAGNNCSSAVTVTVGAGPVPDLIVEAPTVSGTPAVGASFTLRATVRNQGSGRSASTTLRYYLSTDATITAGDTEVGTDYVFTLSAGRTGAESIRLRAPSSAGTYYYGACVESVSGESNTGNNCSSAVTVTVGAGPTPDLIVEAPTVSSSSPAAGASFTLRATVRNQGSGRSASTTLRYYLSTDATVTTSDTEVGTDGVFSLSASRTSSESISLRAPSSAGTYYYGACVESVSGESNTGNNCSSAVTVTVGAGPTPDLIVEAPTVSSSSPAAGASFTLRATVRNQGSGRSASTTLRYYLSTDATVTTSDTEVGTDGVFALSASRTSSESISLRAPSSAGTYYYGACVESVSGESNTGNNCSSAVTVTVGAAPAPDIVVGTPRANPSTPTAGASFILSVTVENQGNAQAAATTLRFYRSTDATISSSDTQVDTDSVPLLGVGGGYVANSTQTAPASAGTYYYGACVASVSGESNTGNNCSPAVTVTVGSAPAPDLVVPSPSVSDSSPTAGASFRLSATVRNQGSGRSAATTLRFYRSTDGRISTSDTEVGSSQAVGGLAASGTSALSTDLTAPSNAGTYYYGACVASVSGESNTGNNCSPAVTVTVSAAGTQPDPQPSGTSKLYWSDWGTDKIQRADLDGSNVQDLVSGAGLNGPDGLSLDLSGGKIYWADAGTNKIQRANLDGSGVEDLVTGLGIPYGLALDVSGGKMYWTNRQTNKIQRANLDGSGAEDLVTSGLTFPGALALDVSGGKMYWTNPGARKIQRADLGGTNVEDLVTSGLSSPLGLALDVAGGKMYWTDRGTDKIQRADLGGANVEDLVTSGLDSPNGLALDVSGGKMYWADEGANKVQRANLDGSGVEDLLTSSDGLVDPSGIAVGAGGSASGSSTTYGVGDALPNVPTGFFVPTRLSGGASLSSSGGTTTITFNNGGVIELQDGTTYTCIATGGCRVENGRVTLGLFE
ncbi:MAG: T9SS type A sorting domain-containing protein [Gemmatimonadaceae bacterium]|nr:T9SS type A sorting domain-containing protein [Gemmatimonadaceae bacterium]